MRRANWQKISLLILTSAWLLSCTPNKVELEDSLEGFWRLKDLTIVSPTGKPRSDYPQLRKELAKLGGIDITLKDHSITPYSDIDELNQCKKKNMARYTWELQNNSLRIYYYNDRHIEEGSVDFKDAKLVLTTEPHALIIMAERALSLYEHKYKKQKRGYYPDKEITDIDFEPTEVAILRKELNSLRENNLRMVRIFAQEKERPTILD